MRRGDDMTHDKRFPPERMAKLDNAKRRELQPPGPVVELVASWGSKVVLDIGVGIGYYAIPLAQALQGGRVIGLDVEPRMLQELDRRLAEAGSPGLVEPLQAPATSIPLDDGAVDLVLMVNLYHELADRPMYLAEVRRVMAPSGRILVVDWDPSSSLEAGPPRDHRVPREVVVEELTAAGFVDTTVHSLYEHVYSISGTSPAR